MSTPFAAMSGISFCDADTTTAMSVASSSSQLVAPAPPDARPSPIATSVASRADPSLPRGLDPVVHPDRGRLVDRDHHRLALMAARDEVVDQVVSDGVEPVVVGDQVVLTGELASQSPLLVLVQLGLLEDALHVAVEVGR